MHNSYALLKEIAASLARIEAELKKMNSALEDLGKV